VSVRERVKVTVEIDVDVEHLARQFAALTDDAQAQFLCLAAADLAHHAGMQAFYIGRHLQSCECSTEEGREFVREIARAMEPQA
jgi:hypothetical protein